MKEGAVSTNLDQWRNEIMACATGVFEADIRALRLMICSAGLARGFASLLDLLNPQMGLISPDGIFPLLSSNDVAHSA